MLIKELSKKSRIPVKDLLRTPTGFLCYVADCFKSGLRLDEIIVRIIRLNIPDNPMLQSINSPEIIEKILHDFNSIDSITTIYDLC